MKRVLSNFRWGFDRELSSIILENGRVVERVSGVVAGGEDLGGKFLLPAFVDNHCHILPTGLDLTRPTLSGLSEPDAMLDVLRDALPEVQPGRWLQAVHYDQNRLPGGVHLSRAQLDSVSSTVPILLRHVNGHASVANSAALREAGIAADEKDPDGGEYVRDEAGEFTGLLLEAAHERVTAAAPLPSLEEMVAAILRAGEAMAEFGIATASDMMTGRFDLERELEAYRLAAEAGCKVRTRLYVQWSRRFGPRASAVDLEAFNRSTDTSRCKVAGIKIFADGAIGSATAAIYGSYTGRKPSELILSRHANDAKKHAPADTPVSGQLMYRPSRLSEMVRVADEAGYQVAIHAIGDYAVDLVMDAYEACPDPSKHRIEHAMLLSNEQIARMADLNPWVTMQPEFLHRFPHAYIAQLGPERASQLKRFRSIVDAGLRLSLSSDRPIVLGDPWLSVRTASARPEGFDPAENLTREEALRAATEWTGGPNGDDDLGHLNPGAHADIIVGDEDPLTATDRPNFARI